MSIKKETNRRNMLSFDERLVIEKLWNVQLKSVNFIARYLNRPRYQIDQELKRGNMLYFKDTTDTTLRSLKLHTKVKYSARYAQQFIDSNKIVHEERHKLTPAIRELVERNLRKGLSPERIKKLYPGEISVSAITIRNYIKQGLIQNTSSKKLDTYRDNASKIEAQIRNTGVSLAEYSKYWAVKVYADKAVYNRTAIMIFVECHTYYTVLVRIEDKALSDYLLGLRTFLFNFQAQTVGFFILNSQSYIADLREQNSKMNIHSFNLTHDLKLNDRFSFIDSFLPGTSNLFNLHQEHLDRISDIINQHSIYGYVPDDKAHELSVLQLFNKTMNLRS
ncbi:hypothetical protein WOSG25_050090 [Weissella oryzae SG25]|uniref:Uncharacterized protein n=1 Tax=Weissella oryzae (strain DSM 25784 / JCM 18191 / LMG 30913 / SG25) TaxID=1329250 RepID=A0A069CTK8_WEIOS|nr:helix-turn-helix domain-containing protein [Weissella oryzae]GAK30737.1 hypothetical protein WOSG25_050090 [Weissella oryzae SG25]